MLHFKPIKNRLIGLQFIYYFIALISGPFIIHGTSGGVELGNSLLLISIAAGLAYMIGYKKAKSHDKDIEIHEDFIVGPGPLLLPTFHQVRVKITIDQLKTQRKSHHYGFSLYGKVVKLGNDKGKHIRIVCALYNKELLETIKSKLS
jgi:hypothetical protein